LKNNVTNPGSEFRWEKMKITHSDGVCFEIFMEKELKQKQLASLDFLKNSDEKQFFFLEWP